MKILLKRLGDNFAFEAKNEEGNCITIDTNELGGGEGRGFTPMQLLLVGIGGCSGIDIVLTLKSRSKK